nr:hypothetical protein Iba_scaffold828501CG0010 [Ipomoea batatas]GMD22938.1 hypothetical protein Iba_scaffold42232CG0020 [Ipomoea batatas]GME21108.1 hypothetical protein Iba_scaffold26837CG0010 [Ipomoea batatas]
MVLKEKTRGRCEGIPIFVVKKEAGTSQEAHEASKVVGFCVVDTEGVDQLLKRDGSTVTVNGVCYA